jgi:hypothetical protein
VIWPPGRAAAARLGRGSLAAWVGTKWKYFLAMDQYVEQGGGSVELARSLEGSEGKVLATLARAASSPALPRR